MLSGIVISWAGWKLVRAPDVCSSGLSPFVNFYP